MKSPAVRYKELRAELNEVVNEITQLYEKIERLHFERDQIEDQLYDLENFDLTPAELAEINREEE